MQFHTHKHKEYPANDNEKGKKILKKCTHPETFLKKKKKKALSYLTQCNNTKQVHKLNKNFTLQNHRLFTKVAEQAQLFTGNYDSGVYFPNNKKRKIWVGTIS